MLDFCAEVGTEFSVTVLGPTCVWITRGPKKLPSLVAEEESFVADTLAEGDMVDLQSAYQSHPQGRTGFWVVTPQGSGGTAQEPVGCIGLRLGKGE